MLFKVMRQPLFALLICFTIGSWKTAATDWPESPIPSCQQSAALSEAATAPPDTACSQLPFSCLTCQLNASSCRIGDLIQGVTCIPVTGANCTGQRQVLRSVNCLYCYQLPPDNYTCELRSSCKVRHPLFRHYETNCTVKANVSCLGKRLFRKMLRCDWSSGYKWSVSMWFTTLLGGFGLDRFYLGQWREGLGKLFSFGGFGVWSLIDAILIAVGYISPSDDSLYSSG